MQGMGITFGAINTVKGWIILRIVGSWAELIAILRSRSNFKIFQIKLRTVSKLKSHFCRSIGRLFHTLDAHSNSTSKRVGSIFFPLPSSRACSTTVLISKPWNAIMIAPLGNRVERTNGQKGGRNRRVQERRLTGLFEIVLTGSDSGVWSSTYMLFVYPYNIVSRSEIQGASRTLNWIQASATAE